MVTVVLFLVSLSLAATLGWMCCALMTAHRVAAADLRARQARAREVRIRVECDRAITAANVYWLERMDERDQQLREMAEFLAVVAP